MATIREQQGQDFYDRRKSKKKSPLRLNREKLEQQSILVGRVKENPTQPSGIHPTKSLIDSVRDGLILL